MFLVGVEGQQKEREEEGERLSKKQTVMKTIQLFIIFLLGAFNIFGQEVKWGPEYRNGQGESIEKLTAQDENGIYVLRTVQRSKYRFLPVLDHYNREMKLQYSRVLKELDKSTVFYTDLFQYNDRLYVAFTKYYGDEQKHSLFYNEINKADGSLIDVPKKVAQIFSNRKHLQGEFQLAASPDSSRAVILFSEVENERTIFRSAYSNFNGSPIKFSLNVYDEKMGALWEKEVLLPYDDDLVERGKLSIDNSGNVHILAKLYASRGRDKVRGKANYSYKIFSFYEDGSTKEYDFSLDDKFISEITLTPNKQNELICAGFYSERDASGVKGAFYFRIDEATREVSKKYFQEFEAEFLAQLIGERRAKKGRELYHYNMKELIPRSDNGAVLVAEQYYIRVVTDRDFGPGGAVTFRERIFYHHNDIILININPDGSIAWSTSVPKRQVAQSPTYSSFAQAVVRDKLYFVFNDRISKRAAVRLASVNSKGEVKIKDLFTNRDADVVTRPILSRQTGKKEMVIYGSLRKKYRFARVRF